MDKKKKECSENQCTSSTHHFVIDSHKSNSKFEGMGEVSIFKKGEQHLATDYGSICVPLLHHMHDWNSTASP